jgi:hypothetical protein
VRHKLNEIEKAPAAPRAKQVAYVKNASKIPIPDPYMLGVDFCHTLYVVACVVKKKV